MAPNGYRKITSTNEFTEKVGFVSILLFQWMNEVMKTGNQRALEESDFVPLSNVDTSQSVTDRLEKKWKEEKAISTRKEKRPKLWKSVLKMLSLREVAYVYLPGVLYGIGSLVTPLLIGYLIFMLMSPGTHANPILHGCFLAAAMTMNTLIGSLAMQHHAYACEILGIRLSNAIKGLVYKKILLLSKSTLLKFSAGRVVDLISNDIQRMETVTLKFFVMMSGALQIVVATFLLAYLIGWHALTGELFLCLLVPYYVEMSSVYAALRLRSAAEGDRRISLTNQVVSGIRAIKARAWEDDFRGKIKQTRKREISIIRKKSVILSGLAALEYTSIPVLLSVISLLLTGHHLTPVNAFMLLMYMNLLRLCFSLDIGYGVVETHEAYVSLGRIEEFLILEDLLCISGDQSKEDKGIAPEEMSVKLQRDFRVIKDQSEKSQESPVTDQRVNPSEPGTLCVSSLKSTEMKRKDDLILEDVEFIAASGALTVVTGPSYNESRYTRVIEACALTKDFQQFPNGDETVVGERGAVLSGGQRARVNLARAVYVDADLYLLDDPLSAVDFKVGRHIFEKCIKDVLGKRTRLLTSHQESHMIDADQVIMLYKGRVLGKGTFVELQDKGILNTTIYPLCKNTLIEKLSDNTARDNEEKLSGVMPLATDSNGLEISVEDRAIGTVSSKLYWDYFRSGIHPFLIIGVVFLCLIAQASMVAPDVWLSFLTRKRPSEQRDKTNLAIYGCFVAASFILGIVRCYILFLVCLRCSERLHDKMVVALLQAPVLFFDSNPVGRILNRFSKDVGCMDELLPLQFLSTVQLVLLLFSSVIVPSVTNPWLVFVTIPVTAMILYFARFYLKSSRELKRLESMCRSPVFSHISETLEGLDTIRTRGRQKDFIEKFYSHQDTHIQSFIMMMASGRWFGVRLDAIISLLVGLVILVAVLISQDAASAGLALAYVIQTVALTQYAVRKSSDVENFMTSVERVMAYTKLDSEPGYKVDRPPPEHWPRKGNIIFNDVSLTYYPGGPQALKSINLGIKGGSKIGVVGRTGAGKSSFVSALLRMPDPDGEILVDGIQIKEINLQAARGCISSLGQTPVLFSGSLRKNLDIVQRFQDVDLWRVLEDVQLKDFVESLEGQLEYELLENGANVSVGERQLICLARVLLQQNKIIILDEPTAYVDPGTEETIWRVVREKLKDSTVITVAHRLNTIRHCDKVIVFKEGGVVESGTFDA
ncbi:Multidrug resistance-associated protein 4 [Stylophora pistillata]|uniref:Multidrug resistance-associated protein 4 n=1 Tax=Stylophora pistillata TaxID=50429 RepID=A0A2B4RZQ6_STYPI|nr:Multidrug resistance-associated protein 4 [Stylophora pistillata]